MSKSKRNGHFDRSENGCDNNNNGSQKQSKVISKRKSSVLNRLQCEECSIDSMKEKHVYYMQFLHAHARTHAIMVQYCRCFELDFYRDLVHKIHTAVFLLCTVQFVHGIVW